MTATVQAGREATGGLDIRTIEQFLYREARLADEFELEAWEQLWTDDAIYWVPAGGDDPNTQMSVIFDNRSRIGLRVRQLNTGKRHSQLPRSRMRRVVSNVEVIGTEENGDTVVEANFVLVESRVRGRQVWAGRYTYRLRTVDGQLRMSYKKVALVDRDHDLPTMSFLI
ncbi:MAG TPA: aromatic-ring-hydroxylating dioxygenase subunit beta [Pseudonocardia sp.]|nr:aromatic-ring-hydroxylating dioxygenase subunit beta [Pseudonocardia sp.]